MPTEVVTDRQIRATRPRPGGEGARAAYLELLKLCLCDLAGAGTASVFKTYESGALYSRELSDDERDYRAAGMDWPLHALTMVGLSRLDDLQSCVETVVADGVAGDLIEAGTWRGGASILMRATLDSLGADERTVWLADSFQGFPAPDAERFPADRDLDLSLHEFLAVPLEEVKRNLARFGLEDGLRFVPGFFAETLPGLGERRWSIVRLDGDTYESTWVALESLYPNLAVGGFLIVDDYQFIAECRQAVDDFRREHGIGEAIEAVDWSCVRWRRESEAAIAPRSAEAAAGEGAPQPSPRSPRRPEGERIPTVRELELERELAALRERLHAAEARLGEGGG